MRDEGIVTKLSRCACCEGPLEPAQQLRFLVETANLDNPAYLELIRVLPSANGKPVPVCAGCQTKLEDHLAARKGRKRRAAPVSLFGALGALSLGVLLGGFFTARG